jgi:hypothetical protein
MGFWYMTFQDLESRERIIVLASISLVVFVFLLGVYNYVNPTQRVWEGKVWKVDYSDNTTVISSYGNGKIRLNGIYAIEEEATYRINYRSRTRNFAQFDIEIQKIN